MKILSMKHIYYTKWPNIQTHFRLLRRTQVRISLLLIPGLKFELLKCQCYGKLENFKEAISVVLNMEEDFLKEAKMIGFDEELKTNFVAQTCYFLLSRKEKQKQYLLDDLSVRN